MYKIKYYLILILLFFSCHNDDYESEVYIDTYTKLFSITKDNILEIVQNSEFENLREYLKYDISLYTITYNTTCLLYTSPSPRDE